MLMNVEPTENLRGLAREMARDHTTSTISPAHKDQYLAEGWEILRTNKRSIRIRKPKPRGVYF